MSKIKATAMKDSSGKSVKTGLPLDVHSSRRSYTTKVTTKGQITMPKRIREHLKLTKGDRIEFLIGIDGKVTVMPATARVQELKGMVAKPKKKVTVADMNKAIEAEGGAV